MSKAFSEEEKEKIKCELKAAARRAAAKYGMKKTTVDDLVEEVQISKGMFYKFYPTKELLFFEMLEDMHSEVYSVAEEVLKTRYDLPDADRLALAFLKAIQVVEENSLMDFLENEMLSLLRKLPPEVISNHYYGDDTHIKEILEISGCKFTCSTDVVSATVRTFILTLLHKKDIGANYDTVLDILIKGVCRYIVV